MYIERYVTDEEVDEAIKEYEKKGFYVSNKNHEYGILLKRDAIGFQTGKEFIVTTIPSDCPSCRIVPIKEKEDDSV